jgi:protein-S-isoprenylcysteine O-methyltransferase Ste14
MRPRSLEITELLQTMFGVALAIVGFALIIQSRVQLGESFSVAPRARDLVTHGLYARMQHPMYIFADLTICGIALAVHRWFMLLPLAVLLPLQIRNARVERRLLGEKFGERYHAYRNSTWL